MSSKLKVNNIIPSTGTQIGISTTGGGINLLTGTVVTGVITATSFSGTSSGNPTLTNGADNRVITATGSNALNGEANLTFDGTKLTVTSSSKDLLYLNSTHSDGPQIPIQTGGTTFSYIGSAASLFSTGSSTDLGFRAESGKHILFGIGGNEKLRIQNDGTVYLRGSSSSDSHRLQVRVNDTDTEFRGSSSSGTNKGFAFYSSNTNGSEKVRIGSDGTVTLQAEDLVFGTSGKGITALGANSSTYGELSVSVKASDFSGSNNVATFKRGSNGAINLAFPSGGGIDFSATPNGPSGVNELLDDYEEGSYTPEISAGYSSISYHNPRIGYYTRVGNHVSFQIYLYVYQATGAAAEINISLPFTAANNTGRETGAYTCYTNGFFSNSSGDKAHCTYLIGKNDAYLRPCKATNGAVIYGNDTYLGTGANNRYLIIAGQMFV